MKRFVISTVFVALGGGIETVTASIAPDGQSLEPWSNVTEPYYADTSVQNAINGLDSNQEVLEAATLRLYAHINVLYTSVGDIEVDVEVLQNQTQKLEADMANAGTEMSQMQSDVD